MSKSSFCQDGGCVDVTRVTTEGEERVRVSSTVDGGSTFTRAEWDAFVAGVRNGELGWDAV